MSRYYVLTQTSSFILRSKFDFFALIRQVARIKHVIILWPGEYSKDTLSYAIPDHHHYKVWNISDSLLIQPKIFIFQISAAEGA